MQTSSSLIPPKLHLPKGLGIITNRTLWKLTLKSDEVFQVRKAYMLSTAIQYRKR